MTTGDNTPTTPPSPHTTPATKRDERDRDKYEKRELFCQLTDDELLEYGKKMAERDREIAVLESKIDALKLNQKALRGEADRLGLDRSRLAIAIDSGQEARDVECVWRESLAADSLMMELVRSDTEEVVDTRPMKPSEQQRALDFANTDDADDEAPAPTTSPAPPASDDDDELLPLAATSEATAATSATTSKRSTRRVYKDN